AAKAARAMHDALHFESFWAMMSYMAWPIALARMKGVRVPYLITLQDGDPFEHVFNRWYILPFRPLLSFGFRRATRISAISTYLDTWAKRLGYKRQVTIVPNGADLTKFVRNKPLHIQSGEPV